MRLLLIKRLRLRVCIARCSRCAMRVKQQRARVYQRNQDKNSVTKEIRVKEETLTEESTEELLRETNTSSLSVWLQALSLKAESHFLEKDAQKTSEWLFFGRLSLSFFFRAHEKIKEKRCFFCSLSLLCLEVFHHFLNFQSGRTLWRETKVVVSSGAMTTRGQKRRKGARDYLWDLVVKCDDICFKHILPRLNGTDLNFLYEVNTETRKVIERSSRARDLKKGFKVSEMS